jgi:hypothetical protein
MPCIGASTVYKAEESVPGTVDYGSTETSFNSYLVLANGPTSVLMLLASDRSKFVFVQCKRMNPPIDQV